MAKRRSTRVPLTFRVSAEAAKRIRGFLADWAGRPLYLRPGSFAEGALLREVERLEIAMATGAPLDRMTGRDDDNQPPPPAPPSRRRINTHAQ
jgi:hypothetical protein